MFFVWRAGPPTRKSAIKRGGVRFWTRSQNLTRLVSSRF